MATQDFSSKLHDAIENYYHYNPDTLMPLLMVALAVRGKLTISTEHHAGAVCLSEITPQEVIHYDWVCLDPKLKKRIKDAIAKHTQTICVEGIIDSSLQDIYDTFHHYDTFTVEEEYHHRIGILYYHSSNRACEQAHRQYAMICLAEALIEAPKEWLEKRFLPVANNMLVKSGLQPERPRLHVAEALDTLLQYDGKGKVYNPFAGCAIAAAAIRAGGNMYADGNENDKLFAVARLLNYGVGGSNAHYAQRDSTKWIDEGKFDYILSTYRGYVDGKSAFDFCLSKCFETLSNKGKFAGIIAPKDIFESQSAEMKEALKRDWVETIALLPFGEVAVLINACKDRGMKSKVRFFDMTHPMLRRRPIHVVLQDDDFAQILRVTDVKKKGYLRSLVVPEIEEREGYKIVLLGDIFKKMKRQTYSLANVPEEGRVLASIEKKRAYNMYQEIWMNGIEKSKISSLFSPAYHLTRDCLITNDRGRLEPRLYDADSGSAFFQDGYAFELHSFIDVQWLLTQLNEPYVLRQLHPYGMDEMVPEAITENQILNLKLYQEIEEEDDPDADKLQMGYVLQSKNAYYTIHKYLGHGYFGYTYSASSKNKATGEEKEVVLKEFYPYRFYKREGVRAILHDTEETDYINANKEKFAEEAKLMNRLGLTPDSHIVPAFEWFESEETGTSYYVMPFYHDGSLKDLQESSFKFTEEMVINNVVKPLCKALHIAHKSKVLHLDIKPENILVDEKGDAILIDFGVAKQYDKDGNIINPYGTTATSMFTPPELWHGNMVKFGGQTDIYGLTSSIFYLLAAPEQPHPIYEFSDQDTDIRESLKRADCSPQFIDAIIAGLQASAVSRPKNAQEFLNLFPGCENIIL